jgi:branched-chain amino acid transport system substrate-binding protein
MKSHTTQPPRAIRRRGFMQGAAAIGASTLAMPNIVAAQGKPIKIGMPSVFSGVFALLGQSSAAGARMEIDAVNAAGGINGRKLELITRDSKGKPDEATKVVRDLISSEGCEIILDAETSASAFAVQELIRELGVLCIHTNSETSSLTANPKIHAPTCFRSARQGIHDSIGGGQYAAGIVSKKNLFKFVTAAPDYAYGRDITTTFVEYAKVFEPRIEVIDQAWPKLFQPDFTEVVTKILQAKPQALYTALFAGDLVALIDQGLLYGLFDKIETFSVNLGDYGVLTQVKQLPPGLHSGTRYNRTVPNTPANEAFYAEYTKKNTDHKICNWSWENATGAKFMIEALKKTGGDTNGKKLAEIIKGMKIESPFGTNGTLTMRASDHTVIDYVVGYGVTVPKEPFIKDVFTANWGLILEHEADWKKRNGFA